MATGGEQVQDERKKIEFVDDLPKELKCSICELVFKEPVLTNCGHHFCQECIAPIVSEKGACPDPECKTQDFTTFLDKATLRKIEALIIKCKKRDEGCPWEGPYSAVEKHLDAEEGDCNYVNVKCTYSSIGCTTKPLRMDLKKHEEDKVYKHFFLNCAAISKEGNETEQGAQERRAELLQDNLQERDAKIEQRFSELQGNLKALQERVDTFDLPRAQEKADTFDLPHAQEKADTFYLPQEDVDT